MDASALIPEVLPILEKQKRRSDSTCRRIQATYLDLLLPDFMDERIKLVEEKSKEFGITVLLKGATDVISDGSTTYLNEKKDACNDCWWARVTFFLDLVAGLLSRSRNPLESAAAAAFINGLAGESTQKRLGPAYDINGSYWMKFLVLMRAI